MTHNALLERTRRFRRRLFVAALPLIFALPARSAAARSEVSACWGPVSAVPSSALIGGQVTFSGSHYHCAAPNDGLLRQAALILYRPGLGFHVFTLHIGTHGGYRQTVRIPAHLRAVSAIRGGPNRSVATRPGVYYLAVRLFDIALPPASQADARITVLPSAPSIAHLRAVNALLDGVLEALGRGGTDLGDTSDGHGATSSGASTAVLTGRLESRTPHMVSLRCNKRASRAVDRAGRSVIRGPQGATTALLLNEGQLAH